MLRLRWHIASSVVPLMTSSFMQLSPPESHDTHCLCSSFIKKKIVSWSTKYVLVIVLGAEGTAVTDKNPCLLDLTFQSIILLNMSPNTG